MISKDVLNFIGVNSSDVNFQVTSIGTYFKDKAMDSLNLLNIYCACLADMSEDDDLDYSQISTLFDTKVQEYDSNLIFDSDHYTNADEGNVRMDQLRTCIINDLYATNNSTASASEYSTAISLYSNDGVEQGSIELDDFFEQLKESAKASYSIGAGMIASQYDSLSDRMTSYNEDIKSKFADNFDDSSGVSEYCRSLLTSGISAPNYMNALATALDMDATLTSTTKDPLNSQIGQMTGRTPAMAWGFVRPFEKIGSAVGKAADYVWKTMKTIVSGIGKWLDSKVKEIKGAANASNDCYIVNENSDAYTVDAWAICDKTGIDYYFQNEDDKAYIRAWVNSHRDGWFKVSTLCGELLFKFESPMIHNNYANYTIAFKYKPKIINLEVYDELMQDLGFSVSDWSYQGLPTASDAEILNALNKFRNNPKLFTETYTDNERYRMVSLCLARNIDQFFPKYIMHLNVVNNVDQGVPAGMFPTGYRCASYINREILPETQYDPNNLDFVHAASSLYEGSGAQSGLWIVPDLGLINPITFEFKTSDMTDWVSFANVGSVAEAFALRLLEVRSAQRLDSQIYIPYLYGDVGFSLSRYGIKTDAQNDAAFNTMIDTIAYITIGVVVGASILTASKILKTAIYTSRSKTISRIGSKMSAGTRITSFEAMKYRRANRTIQKMNARMAGIKTNSVNAYTNLLAANTWNNDDIINLIK